MIPAASDRPAVPLPRITLLPALLLGALLAGCGGGSPSDPEPPEVGDPSSISAVAGDDQIGLTWVPLRDSLVVQVVDDQGRPVPGLDVVWRTTGEDETVPSQSETGDDGTASTLWVLGPDAGADTVWAEVAGLETIFSAEARVEPEAASYEGRNGYITYRPGDLPLILSAGHGGTREPSEIPDRTQGTTVRDMNTDLLAIAMADSLEARLGARPHLIISHLQRAKLDPNRDLPEATQGNPLAEHAWREYHNLIDHASARVEAEHERGFYIDIHGHGHDIPRLELGYLLSSTTLARTDEQLTGGVWSDQSSIRNLAATSPLTFPELLRGQSSLGTLFEEQGVPSVPSAPQPDPAGADYFTGGYATARHGSRDGGRVDGVQIEHHYPGIRESPSDRAAYAGAAATVLAEYLATHYGFTPAP